MEQKENNGTAVGATVAARSGQNVVKELYRQGVEYAAKGAYDQAIDAWNAVLKIEPDHSIAMLAIEMARGDKARAEEERRAEAERKAEAERQAELWRQKDAKEARRERMQGIAVIVAVITGLMLILPLVFRVPLVRFLSQYPFWNDEQLGMRALVIFSGIFGLLGAVCGISITISGLLDDMLFDRGESAGIFGIASAIIGFLFAMKMTVFGGSGPMASIVVCIVVSILGGVAAGIVGAIAGAIHKRAGGFISGALLGLAVVFLVGTTELPEVTIAKAEQKITEYTQKISSDPKYYDLYQFYWSRGNAYVKIGDYDDGIRDLETALSLGSGNPQSSFGTGTRESLQKAINKAKKAREKALKAGKSTSGNKKTAATVTNPTLNLRAGPSTGDKIVKQLKKGDVLTVTGAAKNGWLPVTHGGDSGWVSAELVEMQ